MVEYDPIGLVPRSTLSDRLRRLEALGATPPLQRFSQTIPIFYGTKEDGSRVYSHGTVPPGHVMDTHGNVIDLDGLKSESGFLSFTKNLDLRQGLPNHTRTTPAWRLHNNGYARVGEDQGPLRLYSFSPESGIAFFGDERENHQLAVLQGYLVDREGGVWKATRDVENPNPAFIDPFSNHLEN